MNAFLVRDAFGLTQNRTHWRQHLSHMAEVGLPDKWETRDRETRDELAPNSSPEQRNSQRVASLDCIRDLKAGRSPFRGCFVCPASLVLSRIPCPASLRIPVPAISNALCMDLDSALAGISAAHGVAYTRYADDLFFSTTAKDVLRNIEAEVTKAVAGLQIPRGLRINTAKTRHSSKRGARRVTGIILGSDGQPHVDRQTKRHIRSLVNKVASLNEEELERLAGFIAYVIGFEPDFLNKLILKYGPERVEKATSS
jgi:hypothetical protein